MSARENLALIVSTRPLPREERPSIYFKTQGTPRRERLSTQRPARSGGCTRLHEAFPKILVLASLATQRDPSTPTQDHPHQSTPTTSDHIHPCPPDLHTHERNSPTHHPMPAQKQPTPTRTRLQPQTPTRWNTTANTHPITHPCLSTSIKAEDGWTCVCACVRVISMSAHGCGCKPSRTAKTCSFVENTQQTTFINKRTLSFTPKPHSLIGPP